MYQNVVFGVTPISPSVQVSQLEEFHLTKCDFGNAARRLPCHEIFTAARALVVEQNSVAQEHIVGLPVVPDNPITEHLRNTFSHLIKDSFELFVVTKVTKV